MTEQVTFGELLDLARSHLQQAGAVPGLPGSDHDLLDVVRSMHSLASVIGSYLRDAVTGYQAVTYKKGLALALWTGRLAYADPEWTLASGPRHAVRSTEDVTSRPGELEQVVAAVHHASDALQHLAAAHQQQAWLGARASRFLVATRSLPEDYDIARPYAAATLARANLVLSAYESAHEAAVKATIRTADTAAARAPSQVLSIAAAVSTDRAAAVGSKPSNGLAGEAVITEPPPFPGPLERSLYNLGVTDLGQLQRATELDRATEQLLIDACLDLPIQARETSHQGAASAASQYAIAKRRHAVVAARSRHQEPSHEQPEREPCG